MVTKAHKGPKCSKCAGPMEEGFIPDEAKALAIASPAWYSGYPEISNWTGVKLKGLRRHVVVMYRCSICGFLEPYAP